MAAWARKMVATMGLLALVGCGDGTGAETEPQGAAVAASPQTTPVAADQALTDAPAEQASAAPETESAGIVPPAYLSSFDLYSANRATGVPHYITADFLLLGYALLHENELIDVETRQLRPAMAALLEQAGKALAGASDGEATAANRDFVTVLTALHAGSAEGVSSDRARAEFDLAWAAAGIATSPLWGIPIDYSQFRPRGRHAGDPALEGYFRSYRYASTVWFPVKASAATGVTPEILAARTAQLRQWSDLLQSNKALRKAREALIEPMVWHIGPADDLPDAWIKGVAVGKLPGLLEKARAEKRLPVVPGALIDAGKLGKDESAAEAALAWRLIPRLAPRLGVVMQDLVYDRVGVHNGEGEPDVLVTINGQPVKGFPKLAEVLALLGSKAARSAIEEAKVTAFAGYADAAGLAQQRLDKAGGREAGLIALLKTGIAGDPAGEFTHLWSALLARNAHANLLYSAATQTATGKGGLELGPARKGATIEARTALYESLGQLVATHRKRKALAAWDEYGALLERCIALSRKVEGGKPLDAEEEAFLNDLDLVILKLAGRYELPVVVDVHSVPAVQQVLQAATGFPEAVESPGEGAPKARGPRLTYVEFRQPLASRMTDAEWRNDPRLFKTGVPADRPNGASEPAKSESEGASEAQGSVGGAGVSARDKLDGALLSLIAVGDKSGVPTRQAEVDVVLVDRAHADAFIARAKSEGAECAAKLENHLYCTIPSAAIERLAGMPEVHSMAIDRAHYAPLAR